MTSEEPLAFQNGRFISASEAVLSLSDAGFIWGAVISERLRTFRQKLFRLHEHLRRFQSSCRSGYVNQPRSIDELAQIAEELIERNARHVDNSDELALMIFATPGIESSEPTLIMQTSRLNFERYEANFREGSKLRPMARTIPTTLIDPGIKLRSRLAWWIAQNELRVRSGNENQAEVLLTTDEPECYLRETLIANVLIEFDGAVISPPRSQILNGISLQVAEELCASSGIHFCEKEITLEEALRSGRECFLTNTTFCIAPVCEIAGQSKSVNGSTFQRLLQAWSDLVGVDIRRQFSGFR